MSFRNVINDLGTKFHSGVIRFKPTETTGQQTVEITRPQLLRKGLRNAPSGSNSGGSGSSTSFTWSSDSTFDGLFNFLGTNLGTTGWGNPYPNRVFVNSSRVLSTNNGASADWLFDQSIASNYGCQLVGTGSGAYLHIAFDGRIIPNYIYLRSQQTSSGGSGTIRIEGIKSDFSAETIVAAYNHGSNGTIVSKSTSISTSNEFVAIRFVHQDTILVRFIECEIWGTYYY